MALARERDHAGLRAELGEHLGRPANRCRRVVASGHEHDRTLTGVRHVDRLDRADQLVARVGLSREVVGREVLGEPRCLGAQRGQRGLEVCGATRGDSARALDDAVRLEQCVEGAVVTAAVVGIPECQNAGGVSALCIVQRLRQHGPVGLGVESRFRGAQHGGAVDLTATGGRKRVVVESLTQRVPASPDIGRLEVTRGLALAPRRPVVEGPFEPDQLRSQLLLVGVALGLDDRVEHHDPNPIGEHRGVRRPEVRPVRGAEVRDLLVADRGPNRVHVAGRVLGGIEAQRVAVLLLAAIDETVVSLVLQGLLLRIIGCLVDVEVLILELVGHAVDAA